jgi:hypothetical protein
MELCDEAGNVFGRFVPDENSTAFRQLLKNLDSGISQEEMERRAQRACSDGHTTEEVLRSLRSR